MTIQEVNLESLQIDPSYQRGLKPHHKKIAENFDVNACKPLTICRRDDGSLWVVDGQQRRGALLILKKKVWTGMVIASSGQEFEAGLCKILNGGDKTVKSLTTRELFRTRLTAKDETAVSVVRAVQAGGLKIGTEGRKAYPNVACLSTLCKIVDRHGEDCLRKVCEIIVTVWKDSDFALHDFMIMGLSSIVTLKEVKIERLIECLKKKTAKSICEDILSRKINRQSAAYTVLSELYNKGLRSRRIKEQLRKSSVEEE